MYICIYFNALIVVNFRSLFRNPYLEKILHAEENLSPLTFFPYSKHLKNSPENLLKKIRQLKKGAFIKKLIHLPSPECSLEELNKILETQGYKIVSIEQIKENSLGGLLVGRSHQECNNVGDCGIKAEIKGEQSPIEMEGGEVVITKGAVNDDMKHDFDGKKMTNKEILSLINKEGGGVSF